jgi:squalene-hopene/tetraprenyl-beta-curcumene cyclase
MSESLLQNARAHLLAECGPHGWTGELSSSALATAIATFALARIEPDRHRDLIQRGYRYLLAHQNADGGWGDSPESPSNITATVLAWSALSAANTFPEAVRHAEEYIGDTAPSALTTALAHRYGDDKTFCGPILMFAALAGRVDWDHVPQLPFELAPLPDRLWKTLKLTVVSYALPALIAIGLCRHRQRPSAWPVRWLRDAVTPRCLRIVEEMQPSNGGFEEATPLTGFVALALSAAGYREHIVVRRAVEFLVASARRDGSWPIDTNLATWVTVLAVNALEVQSEPIRDWLLAQQSSALHPLTRGAPGGWGWSDLPGSMPDADDTAGVLVALRRLAPVDERARTAAANGVQWLLDLQNRDGGIPTFSRGWGKLPFDRSSADITAHALRAFDAWRAELPATMQPRVDAATKRAVKWLARTQRADGAWEPLWFGNQWAPGEENPTYGTAQVIIALRAIPTEHVAGLETLIVKGVNWLVGAQNADGSWGGAPGVTASVEETALAVAALAGTEYTAAVQRGTAWLETHTANGCRYSRAPIGLYFAKLWYSEKLYAPIFTAWAARRVRNGQTLHKTVS